jgi:hypothetical protein
MHFGHGVLKSRYCISAGLEKHSFNPRVSATPVVLTLKKAYSEPVPISALNMGDIHHFVSCIPDEHRNIYDEILAWPVGFQTNSNYARH